MQTGKQRIETQVPSRALLQAIDDLERIENLPGYVVDMGTWHAPDGDGDGVCGVCLGGAMLARVVGYDGERVIDPGDLHSPDEERVVGAMDRIRLNTHGTVRSGLRDLGASSVAIEAAFVAVGEPFTTYDENPTRFKAQRRQIAYALAYHGE